MPNRILIVDDEPFNLDLLEQELSEQNFVVERAVDGLDALEKTGSFNPDVILLDSMMPKMNGLEVLQQLRRSETHRLIPVILVTAKASLEDKIAGLDAGADDYITKPFDSFELLARIRAMLRIKDLHDQLAQWNRTLAQKVDQQVKELQRMERLKRYLSPQIAASILLDETDLFRTHRREITIVFLDLRGFTAFSDSAEPEEVMDFLRAYHTEMGKLVFDFEGTLERFMGDGIVVIFNDPIACENHPRRAAEMALRMRDKARELHGTWAKTGFALDLGIGLVSGYATLGTVGFEGRMDYATIGNLPNLAARLCAEAKGGQVLTDQKTMGKLDEFFEAEPCDEFHLKGIARPIAAFNLGAKVIDCNETNPAEHRQQLFLVRFWGVRGSYPGLTRATREIGGHTSCVEVTAGKHRLIFDAGTGIIPLGQNLAGQNPPQLKSHVFISHTHLDHIFGLCFFDPLRIVGARTLIYGPGWKSRSFDSRFQQLTQTSMLPVALQDLKGTNRFLTVNGGEAIVFGSEGKDPTIRRVGSSFQAKPDQATVTTHSSPAHPGNGVMLYRIDYRGKSLVYASDVEQSEEGYPDIIEFCRGTDLLIHDAQYLRPEYYSKTKAKKGWGHSTIEMAVNVARRSGAKRLALFHHDPMHDDRVMQRIEKAARKSFPGSLVAREGGKLAL